MENKIDLDVNNEENSQNVEKKVLNVMSIMRELCKVIEKENRAISEQRMDIIKSLQEKKRKLTHAYSESVKALNVYKDEIKNFSEDKKAVIKRISTRLSTSAKTNEALLKSGISASKRLLDTIVKTANSEEQKAKGFYSNTGEFGNKNPYKSALSVNQEF